MGGDLAGGRAKLLTYEAESRHIVVIDVGEHGFMETSFGDDFIAYDVSAAETN